MTWQAGLPPHLRAEKPDFPRLFGLVVNCAQHATGKGWQECSDAACMAHDDDLASLSEWVDLTIELARRGLPAR